jgi:hypothetical protein
LTIKFSQDKKCRFSIVKELISHLSIPPAGGNIFNLNAMTLG